MSNASMLLLFTIYKTFSYRPETKCESFTECMRTPDGWRWLGGGSVPPLEIDPSHQAAVGEIDINGPKKCVKLKDDSLKLDDKDCDEEHVQICTINYGGSGFGASIAVANYESGTITCPVPPPTPPTEASMAASSDQPALMCPGLKAKYECDAGGVNVRSVSFFQNKSILICPITYQLFAG